MTDSLIAPSAKARFVVTLPPEPSRVGEQLQKIAGASFTTLTNTQDAFLHLARRARDRLVIMTPYIDSLGAEWAADLFDATEAKSTILVLRGTAQIDGCGQAGQRLSRSASRILDYSLAGVYANGQPYIETFHAKIVLADGAAAYVGSANFLYRSRETNLECGFLMEGDAVAPVAVLVDALLAVFAEPA
ncbi:phospholipase D-like domain-containing protein [Bradyrhizobium sp. Cp5.3]|uniref:phospholipase D-like domain-containing protein n=1 Tax=Bradyrhizobium sp. Cp5.3 TaxID=443598 RepID=UPI000487F35A|nr:phospholipase D-like domain-containing protein [Bradyrhizobium sp. Cp5.3]